MTTTAGDGINPLFPFNPGTLAQWIESINTRLLETEKVLQDLTDKTIREIEIDYDDKPFIPPDILEVWRDTPQGPIFVKYVGKHGYEKIGYTLDTLDEWQRLTNIMDKFNVRDDTTGKDKICLRLSVENSNKKR